MPAELTVPIEVHSGAPNLAAQISIKEVVIRPPRLTEGGEVDMPGELLVSVAQGDGPNAANIGVFRVTDNADSTLQNQVGGRLFRVAVGNHFSDASASSPEGDTLFDAVKSAVYQALQSAFPDLSGPVS